MRVVFALGGHTFEFCNFDLKIKSILISFFYKNLEKYVNKFPDAEYMLLDSGAFSAWSIGSKIDVVEYADWIHQMKHTYGGRINTIEAINLDVITDKNDSKEVLKKALDTSLKNLHYLKSRGHNVLPVHHQFECYSVLNDYAKDFDFICISPNNKQHTNSKRNYLDNCFSRIKATKKTHGLAVTAEPLIMRYPWFSVDSSVAEAPFRFGHLGVRRKRRIMSSTKEGVNRNKGYIKRLSHETIKELIAQAETATKLWKLKGVEWEM